MQRRKFIRNSSLAITGIVLTKDVMKRPRQKAWGYNGMLYTLDTAWSKADTQRYPVNDCHEMVQDRQGRILLLTNETHNNILIYDTDGHLMDSWGHDFPGGHGLTLHDENGTEFLYITDIVRHQVYKTTLDGKILLTIDAPLDAGIYKEQKEFVPTETAIDANGDIFIADGYGAQGSSSIILVAAATGTPILTTPMASAGTRDGQIIRCSSPTAPATASNASQKKDNCWRYSPSPAPACAGRSSMANTSTPPSSAHPISTR
jgi:hypothetical protein